MPETDLSLTGISDPELMSGAGAGDKERGEGAGEGEGKFGHERLHVYRASLEFVEIADQVINGLPKGRAYLAKQLQRAASSIPLNIAEGAGEFAPRDKARLYRIALRSATECAATLDVCHTVGIGKAELISEAKGILMAIVGMLTNLVKRMGEKGKEMDQGRGLGSGRRSGRGRGR